MRFKSIEERFWAKVDKNGPVPPHCPELGPCWVWTGSKHGQGRNAYGAFHARSCDRPVKTHRFVFELVNGAIPDGLWVLHKCDNPPCVRPNHLYLGSHTENMRDMQDRNRTHTSRNVGRRNGIAKLTDADIPIIRARWATGASLGTIAKEYGVTAGTIRYVVKGGGWAHV